MTHALRALAALLIAAPAFAQTVSAQAPDPALQRTAAPVRTPPVIITDLPPPAPPHRPDTKTAGPAEARPAAKMD